MIDSQKSFFKLKECCSFQKKQKLPCKFTRQFLFVRSIKILFEYNFYRFDFCFIHIK